LPVNEVGLASTGAVGRVLRYDWAAAKWFGDHVIGSQWPATGEPRVGADTPVTSRLQTGLTGGVPLNFPLGARRQTPTHLMRLLGYALLVIGFAAINWKLVQVREIRTAIVLEQLPPSPRQETFSRDEMYNAVAIAAGKMADRTVDWLYLSATVILGGGIVLDVAAGRRRKAIDSPPKITATGSPSRGQTVEK
jgi:hypothetical protein